MFVQPVSNNRHTFGVRIKNRQVKGIVREIKEVSDPFIKEEQPRISYIRDLKQKFRQSIDTLSDYTKMPQYNTANFKEAKRLRLGEIDDKRKEYEYLSKKSQRWFVTPDVEEYAEEIRPLFAVPEPLKAPFAAYKQLQHDIYNGLNGRNLPSNLQEKFNGLNKGSDRLICLTSPYNYVLRERRNVDIYLTTGVRDTKKFKRSLDNIKDEINFHNENLPDLNQRVSQAENLYSQHALTKEDRELIATNPQQKIISRCVSKFNKKVADVNLTEQDNNTLNEQLQKQQEALETLWNKIEICKKKAFAPQPRVRYNYHDDMPF